MKAQVINFDEYADVGIHWIALYTSSDDVIYFDSFGVERVPKDIRHVIGNVIKDKNKHIQITSK